MLDQPILVMKAVLINFLHERDEEPSLRLLSVSPSLEDLDNRSIDGRKLIVTGELFLSLGAFLRLQTTSKPQRLTQ